MTPSRNDVYYIEERSVAGHHIRRTDTKPVRYACISGSGANCTQPKCLYCTGEGSFLPPRQPCGCLEVGYNFPYLLAVDDDPAVCVAHQIERDAQALAKSLKAEQDRAEYKAKVEARAAEILAAEKGGAQ